MDYDKIVEIFPYGDRAEKIANGIMQQIREILPSAGIVFYGSAALKIHGQRDIDISVVSDKHGHFEHDRGLLIELFGKVPDDPAAKIDHRYRTYSLWELSDGDFTTEVTINDRVTGGDIGRHLKMFDILKSNEKIREEYIALKYKYEGKTAKEYCAEKQEFFRKFV